MHGGLDANPSTTQTKLGGAYLKKLKITFTYIHRTSWWPAWATGDWKISQSAHTPGMTNLQFITVCDYNVSNVNLVENNSGLPTENVLEPNLHFTGVTCVQCSTEEGEPP